MCVLWLVPRHQGRLLLRDHAGVHAELKEQREITKANFEAKLITLDDYLGKVGALTMKTAKKKVASDDPENERVKWKQWKTANERTAPKANANNPHKRRGRVPNILNQTKVDEPNAESVVTEPIVVESTTTETASSSLSRLPWPDHEGFRQDRLDRLFRHLSREQLHQQLHVQQQEQLRQGLQ